MLLLLRCVLLLGDIISIRYTHDDAAATAEDGSDDAAVRRFRRVRQ